MKIRPLIFFPLLCGSLSAQPLGLHKTFVLASPGKPVPGGTDTMGNSGFVALSDGGAAFRVRLEPSGADVIYSVTPGGIREVLRVGTVIPDYGEIVSMIGQIRASDDASAVVYVTIRDSNGVSREALVSGNSTPNLRVIAIEDQNLPDLTGQFSSYSVGTINAEGDVAFWTTLKNVSGPYGSTGIFIKERTGGILQVARTGQIGPGETYPFSGLDGGAVIRKNKQALFTANIQDPVGGSGGNRGIYRREATSGNLIRIARSRNAAPGTTKYFGSGLAGGDMNNRGDAVIYAPLVTGTGSFSGYGLFKGNSEASLSAIAYTGQTAPAGMGTYTAFDNSIGINDRSEVAYVGYCSGGVASSGVFFSEGATRKLMLKSGDLAPGGNTYTGFAMARANAAGTVVFAAQLNGNSTYQGIYLTDGVDTIKVVQTGDTVDGRTIQSIGIDPSAFNSLQQVAYQARLSGQSEDSLLVFAPKLIWRGHNSGSWNDPPMWTASLVPAEYNDVDIIPETGIEVTGPSEDTKVGRLNIGANQSGITNLKLQTGVLTSTEGISILSRGSLSGVGAIVGNVSNGSMVSPGNSPGAIQITGNYTQQAAGSLKVEVAGDSGGRFDRLTIEGDASLDGTIDLQLLSDATAHLKTGSQLPIVTTTGTLQGTFSNAANGNRIVSTDGLASFRINYGSQQVTLDDFQATDSDSDGLPDLWMLEKFGKTTGSAEDGTTSIGDADGDGMSNRDEFIAGTNPAIRSSVLSTALDPATPAGHRVTISTVEGRIYAIEYSPDLGEWETVRSNIPGDGTEQTFTIDPDPESPNTGFYRVVVSR